MQAYPFTLGRRGAHTTEPLSVFQEVIAPEVKKV